MKEKKSLVYPKSRAGEASVLRECALVAGEPSVTVRDAKAHFSALLDLVAEGRSITITSDGRPKARLVSIETGRTRKTFQGASAHLARMPRAEGGPTADELIREDRDGRG